MSIATTLLLVFSAIDLSSQTFTSLRGPPSKLRPMAARLNHGHLLARKLLSQKAYMMSKMAAMSPLTNSGPPFPVGRGHFADNTMVLPQHMTGDHQAYTTLPGRIDDAVNTQGVDDSLMATLNRDLFRVVNSVPGVVSVTVGSPGSLGVNDRVNNNNVWRGTANGETLGDNIGVAGRMGGIERHTTNRDVNFSPENSNIEFNFNSGDSPIGTGFVGALGADRSQNKHVHVNQGLNNDNFNNNVDLVGQHTGELVQSSVDNGVRVFKKASNNGEHLFEMGLPVNPNSHDISFVGLNPMSERIPSTDTLQPDRGDVNKHVDAKGPGTQMLDLNKGVDITNTLAAGLLDIQAVDLKQSGVSFGAESSNVGQFSTDGLRFNNGKSPSENNVRAPQSLVPEVLLSFDNAYVLIPATGKSRDINSQSRASVENNLLDGSIQIPSVPGSTELRTIAGMELSATKQGSNGPIRPYDPFSARLQPEAFGPGPYYECAPPAQVLCGARIGWDHVTGMADWCKGNCIVFNYSSYCDDDRCQCECVTSGETVVR